MYVDDTKDKVYIHDIDAELAEIEQESEPKIEFLPDIEKKLAAFPSLLESQPMSPSQGQLVLYRPVSFPEEVQNTRKAIIESHRKARESSTKQATNQATEQPSPMYQFHAHATQQPSQTPDDDPDAMEIG